MRKVDEEFFNHGGIVDARCFLCVCASKRVNVFYQLLMKLSSHVGAVQSFIIFYYSTKGSLPTFHFRGEQLPMSFETRNERRTIVKHSKLIRKLLSKFSRASLVSTDSVSENFKHLCYLSSKILCNSYLCFEK